MLFRWTFCFLLFLTVSVLPGFGQQRPAPRAVFSIEGNVRDDTDQHPMENIRVDLKQSTGVPINTTFTRGNGEFEFGGLTNGDYTIEINVKDYDPARETVSIFNGGRRGITVFLTRPITMVNSGPGGSISAHQLSVPHRAHDEYQKGMTLLYGKSDFRGAILQFQRAIKDFPTYYEAYAEVGSAYMRLNEMAPAEEALRKSVDISGGQYADALLTLSGLLTDLERYPDAATYAQKAINVDGSSWRGPFELARALSGLKKAEEAEKSALQARDMKPDNPPVYLMLANIHIQLHAYPALLKDLDAFLKLVSTGPDADQARKMRDDLQAKMQQAENQARSTVQQDPGPNGQDSPRGSSPPPAHEKEMPPPLEPDSSGLPSLPPPNPTN